MPILGTLDAKPRGWEGKAGDLDWNGGTIRIKRARVRAVIKATKKSSIRDVDLIDRTLGSSRLPAVFQLREGRRRADLR